MIKILFVCTGNICRSPLAHGIFQDYVTRLGLVDKFIIDSAGTSNYHVGSLPDARSCEVAKLHGFSLTHQARAFMQEDFNNFDYILVMDHLNYEDLVSRTSSHKDKSKILLLRSFDEASLSDFDVPDPYYGFIQDFEDVFVLCESSIKGFMKFLQQNHSELK